MTPARTDLRLMGVNEASRCLGVTHQRLRTMRYHPEFPPPAQILKCGVIWWASDIETYASTRNRIPGRRRKAP